MSQHTRLLNLGWRLNSEGNWIPPENETDESTQEERVKKELHA